MIISIETRVGVAVKIKNVGTGVIVPSKVVVGMIVCVVVRVGVGVIIVKVGVGVDVPNKVGDGVGDEVGVGVTIMI